jgi:formylglycine-generating enzyme required for sulfatase activity
MAKLVINTTQKTAQYYIEDLGNEIRLEMVLIPGGDFLMGSPEDELERQESESPQHLVNIKPFCMGKYPVTQAQWQAVAALEQVSRELDPEPSNFKGKKLPVEQVSWYDAVEFCDRLTAHTKRQYRLPSEAEWEYGCRAGTTTPFHFGETITTDLANYRGTDNEKYKRSGSYGLGPKGIYREKTTVVGTFDVANAFGLYDMHGNVWEWCADHWHENYEGATTDGSAWIDPANDNDNRSRLLRGGSWNNNPDNCRSASRNNNNPDNRNNNIGFRVVCAGAVASALLCQSRRM